jgi:hypothetical protein
MKYKIKLKQRYEENILNKLRTRRTFKTCVDSQVNTESNELKRNVIEQYKEDNILDLEQNFTMKTIENYIKEKSLLDKETGRLMGIVQEYDQKETVLRELLEKLKLNELNRLLKEFFRHDYERRFNTNRNFVIAALIGEENTQNELFRQFKEEKVR